MSQIAESKKIIEDLLFDIEEEKCVLLIGPEISGSDGRPLMRTLHEQLLEQAAQYIDYYYLHDRLFLFKNEVDKKLTIRKLKRLYRNMEAPEALYKKILELPIPLIISLNPDTMLSQVANDLGLVHDFRHFRYSGEANDKVEAPSNQRPLFYNLSGCLAEERSLVLDYEDLFELLRAVLPDGLPNKLRMHLRGAQSFLFLGFDFEKWYSQLLLQLLTHEDKGRPKIAYRGHPKDGNAKDFLVRQFDIQFLADDEHFFDLLHGAVGEAKLLRSLSFPQESGAIPLEDLKGLITAGDLAKAISTLSRFKLDAGSRQELDSLQARYQHWKSSNTKGLYHIGESEPILNRITNDFLNLLNKLS